MNRLSAIFLFSVIPLAACEDKGGGKTGDTGDTGDAGTDADGDGYDASEDCDDGDASVYPGATEVCDEKDNDCDDEVDEDAQSTFYADADGDGYGDANAGMPACDAPTGYVADDTDCDDAAADVHPGADEYCDDVDQDCDGETRDDDSVDALTAYSDEDEDGFGDDATAWTTCDIPSGYVGVGGDCDDANPNAYPGATEVCDGVQNDCAVAWTSDAGLADFVATDGTRTDVAGELALGTAGAPVGFAVEAGTLYLCEGTWYATLTATGVETSIAGIPDATLVSVSGGGAGRPLTISGGVVAVTGLTITGGLAEEGGGVRIDGGATVEIAESVIDANAVADEGSGEATGGGIYSTVSTLTLTGSTVSLNGCTDQAVCTGGGLYAEDSTTTVEGTSFISNALVGVTSSGKGAGAAIDGGTASFRSTEFTGNTAETVTTGTVYGGGLFAKGSAVVDIEMSSFTGNALDSPEGYAFGGGLMLDRSGAVTGANVLIADNTVASASKNCGGAGAAMQYGSASLALTNAIVTGNASSCTSGSGGAFYVAGATLSLQNADVAGNSTTGSGGAIYSSFVTGLGAVVLSLNNTTLASNTATTAGAMYASGASGTTFTATYSDFYDNGTDAFTGVTDPSGDATNLAVDPLYTDTSATASAGWDLHLQAKSPLIDAGDPAILDADKSASDIGAYGGPAGASW